MTVAYRRMMNFHLVKKKSFGCAIRSLGEVWQDISCNSQADEIHDLLQFGKGIKYFLDKYIEKS